MPVTRLAWFSIDPYVYLVNERGENLNRIYAGSDKLSIKPLKNKRPQEFSIEEYESYFAHIAKTGWYASMYFDPIFDLYYRIGFQRTVDGFSNSNQIYASPFIIVLNDKFQKIGEFEIDNRFYDINSCFVGPKGFYILNKLKQAKDEDFLHFNVFQVVAD